MGVDLVECGSHLMFQVESIYFSITNKKDDYVICFTCAE
ncbi:hypothetical protein NTHI1209_00832 [Haemophilus influenzae]|uniref:Uncharacterized protein n=1 Tax=Haemophilus influenzae TaxID=727 RepID=A0A158SWI4_HAEIF|nr:hypothetical protein NTHI1209_00832 [Haemophilus influenzae]